MTMSIASSSSSTHRLMSRPTHRFNTKRARAISWLGSNKIVKVVSRRPVAGVVIPAAPSFVAV